MKELAKYIVRSRLPAKTRRPARPPEPEKTTEPESKVRLPDPDTLPDHSVYKPLDSWETRYRPEKDRPEVPEINDPGEKPKRLTRARKTFDTSEEPEITISKKDIARRKKRNNALSICVSEEEAELLRKFAASKGYYFSEWARDTLFRAMKRKPPARPKVG